MVRDDGDARRPVCWKSGVVSEYVAPVGVCLACLQIRADVDAAWLAEASADKKRTTYFASDELAFPARESVTSSAVRPRCRRSAEVIPVDREMAVQIAIFVATRAEETDD